MMQQELQQQLLQSVLETQEYSLNKISRELHDNIGQLLSSTKMLLGIAEMELDNVPDTLKTAEQTLSKAIQDVRLLSKSINKEWLHEFNLIENLQAEKQRINAGRDIQVELNSKHEKLALEPEAQVILFRVVLEALHNSIKHASAKQIVIKIEHTANNFQLTVKDDGHGFDIESAKKESTGLRNMEQRIKLLGGNIKWISSNKKGTLIKIRIPTEEE
jgi:signal transduction histidine kinase